MMPVRKNSIGNFFKDRSRLVPPNYSNIQTDEWEIPENEISIFKDEPLGEGCFGKVYKGLLMGQSIQKRPSGTFRLPIFSLTCTVAIKQLKSKSCDDHVTYSGTPYRGHP